MEQINREVQKKKPISLNIQDSVEMAKLKSQFIEKEPIHEGTRRTPEMLKSNVSKKLLAYFFDNYSEVLKTFQSKNRREGFVNEMREILSSEKDLSEQNTFNLEDQRTRILWMFLIAAISPRIIPFQILDQVSVHNQNLHL